MPVIRVCRELAILPWGHSDPHDQGSSGKLSAFGEIEMHQLFVTESGLMSSGNLLELVNNARRNSGEKPVRHNDFVARCADELDGEHYETFVVDNPNGTQTNYIKLTVDQCKLVAMRESKAVRRAVLSRLNEMESKSVAPAIPDFSNPAVAARAWAEQYEANQALAIERDHAIATKAEIGSRREATAMNTASVAVRKANSLERQLDKAKDYCTVKRMSMIHHGQHFDWRSLKAASAEMELPPIDVFDQNYGTVKAYHVDVWAEVYGLGIDQ